MPKLEFQLSNTALTYKAEKDFEEWILSPHAQIQKVYNTFKVFIGSDVYDGFRLGCSVIIKQRTPKNIEHLEGIARIAQQASDGKIPETAIKGCVGTVTVQYSTEEENPKFQPYFEVVVLLSNDAFFRAQTHLETCVAHLSIYTDPFEGGLFKELEDYIKWQVDRVAAAIAEKIVIEFKTHSDQPGQSSKSK
ncbi:MAG: hypothetical protein WB870_04925 [Gallionellaceae bacterium]